MKKIVSKEIKKISNNIPEPMYDDTFQVYPSSLSEKDLENAIVFERLHLYNNCKPCGAIALQKYLRDLGLEQVPSSSKINRILSKHCLTNGRTGFYPEDYPST
jgi:hypothetical protein